MSDVARYRPWPYSYNAEMQRSHKGDYVAHDDYTAMRALAVKQNEALKAMVSDVNRSDYHTRRAAFEQARAALAEAKRAGIGVE